MLLDPQIVIDDVSRQPRGIEVQLSMIVVIIVGQYVVFYIEVGSVLGKNAVVACVFQL